MAQGTKWFLFKMIKGIHLGCMIFEITPPDPKKTPNLFFLVTQNKSNQLPVKPRYNAPALNIIPPIEYLNFSPKKYFYSFLYVGNSENLSLAHNFVQSLEMRYSGV